MTKIYRKAVSVTAVLALAFVFSNCGSSDKPAEQAPATPAAPADNGEGIGNFAGKEIAPFDAGLAEKGKTLFEAKCSACHKITGDKVVGPGLKGVTERRKPQWILNMITNPVEMTQKDPAAQALLAEHLTQMTNQNVAEDEALSILNYLRQNDGAK